MPKQIPDFYRSWTSEELENDGFDEIIHIIRIAKKRNISISITTDGYTLVLEGQLADSDHNNECYYSFVKDD